MEVLVLVRTSDGRSFPAAHSDGVATITAVSPGEFACLLFASSRFSRSLRMDSGWESALCFTTPSHSGKHEGSGLFGPHLELLVLGSGPEDAATALKSSKNT